MTLPRDFAWYEAEARKDRREKRRRHNARVTPLANRRTSKSLPESKQLDLANDYRHQVHTYPVARIYATRYKRGIEIRGHATADQLVELRDALNSHISEVLEDADE